MNKKTSMLQQQNNQMDALIKDENQELFTDMICYLRSSVLSDYDIEVVRQDIIEMTLSAQERGDDLHTIIGDDAKGFCDEIIANLPQKTKKEIWIDYMDILCRTLSILLTIYLVFSRNTRAMLEQLINGAAVDGQMDVSIGDLVSMVCVLLLAFFIVYVMTKKAFQMKKATILLFSVGIGLLLILGILVTASLRTDIVFSIPIGIVCLLAVLLYLAHRGLGSI